MLAGQHRPWFVPLSRQESRLHGWMSGGFHQSCIGDGVGVVKVALMENCGILALGWWPWRPRSSKPAPQ